MGIVREGSFIQSNDRNFRQIAAFDSAIFVLYLHLAKVFRNSIGLIHQDSRKIKRPLQRDALHFLKSFQPLIEFLHFPAAAIQFCPHGCLGTLPQILDIVIPRAYLKRHRPAQQNAQTKAQDSNTSRILLFL